MARKKTGSSGTGRNQNSRTKTVVSKTASDRGVRVENGDGVKYNEKMTSKEKSARQLKKYATTTFGFHNRAAYSAYSSGDMTNSQYGNFYSPQLSTDFLEKPQNLRERRAWYRHFYNSNEFVGQSIDLHSTLPLSKVRLEKPKCKNEKMAKYVYDFYVEMCDELNLFRVLMDISHEYWLMGNTFAFCEDHDPYRLSPVEESDDRINEIKEWGKIEAERLFKEHNVIDKDPNYKGWRKVIILPPDQVRMKKIPLSDESLIEFIPDPETRKSILRSQDSVFSNFIPSKDFSELPIPEVPQKLVDELRQNGSIPLDTDPYSGSHVAHVSRKKSQYETLGVSILERCVNTLLLQDKLRQAQTSIASRHMTPIRIVWAEELSETDVEALREQVDLALVDPDFSIITNYQVNWEEMGSNGRLLELSTEYDHIENSLFAGLGVTRELLTGEGTYAGSRITLEILNTQYLLFREILQEFVENHLFKPVAKKKGFVEKDEFGREKLIYPKLSFTRLSIRDNDTFFDQAMQLYNKGSISIDVILDMLNIDPVATKKKIEADLFTTNDFAFNQLMVNMYTALGQDLITKYDVSDKIANYLNLNPLPEPPAGEGAGEGGGGAGEALPGLRFASNSGTKGKLNNGRLAALGKIIEIAQNKPEKLDAIMKFLNK